MEVKIEMMNKALSVLNSVSAMGSTIWQKWIECMNVSQVENPIKYKFRPNCEVTEMYLPGDSYVAPLISG